MVLVYMLCGRFLPRDEDRDAYLIVYYYVKHKHSLSPTKVYIHTRTMYYYIPENNSSTRKYRQL